MPQRKFMHMFGSFTAKRRLLFHGVVSVGMCARGHRLHHAIEVAYFATTIIILILVAKDMPWRVPWLVSRAWWVADN